MRKVYFLSLSLLLFSLSLAKLQTSIILLVSFQFDNVKYFFYNLSELMQLCTVRRLDLLHVQIGRKANHYYEILLKECWSVILNYKQLNTMIFIKVEYVSSC